MSFCPLRETILLSFNQDKYLDFNEIIKKIKMKMFIGFYSSERDYAGRDDFEYCTRSFSLKSVSFSEKLDLLMTW